MFQLRDQLGDQHASLKSCEIYVFVILLLRGYVYWISTGTIASRRNGHTTSLHVSVGPKIRDIYFQQTPPLPVYFLKKIYEISIEAIFLIVPALLAGLLTCHRMLL